MSRWEPEKVEDRLLRRLIPEPNSGCYIWLGPISNSGYGLIKINERMHLAHRKAWEFFKGSIPNGLHVLHRCDVKLCCNLDHLWLGTHSDNMIDRSQKGRWHGAHGHPAGEKHPSIKLTNKQISAIRKDTRPNREISEAYGISNGYVSKIRRKETRTYVRG